MSEDLIKRSDAIKDLCDISNNSDMPEDWHRGMSVAISALSRGPSADRPQGEWIGVEEDWRHQIEFWKCSECDFAASSMYNYCPNCGARMKGADDEVGT